MSEPAIKTVGLTKRYDRFTAVNKLDLEVAEGGIFGFIGPNGAGKSTTIKMLSGLLKPTSGKAFVQGVDVSKHPGKVKRIVGYMPELFGTYDRMRVWEYLDFFGAAYRIPKKKRKQQVEWVMELTGTEYMRDYFVGTLSKGMRQRVGIAKTLVHDPSVLFLDEPSSGLDPMARIEIRVLLRKLKELGKTVLISSHILPELASVCDTVGIIEKSKLLAIGPIKKIMDEVRERRQVQVELLSRAEEAAEILKEQGVMHIKVVENCIQFEFEGDDERAAELLRLLHVNAFDVCWMNEVEADLEEVFIRVTGKGNPKTASKGKASRGDA
jgi:ABC-2 type transport system ATP-binding protein